MLGRRNEEMRQVERSGDVVVLPAIPAGLDKRNVSSISGARRVEDIEKGGFQPWF